MWKSLLKQHGRNPIDPAILAAIRHRLVANKKKTKNADARVWGDARRDQKPETLFFWPIGLLYILTSLLLSSSDICDPLRRNETCPPDLTFIDMYTRLTSNSRAFQWYKCYFRSLFHSGIIERWREPSLCGPFRFWISRFGENQH